MLKLKITCFHLLVSKMSHRRPKKRKGTECQHKKAEIGKRSTSNKFKKWTKSWKEESNNSTTNRKERSNPPPESLSKYFSAWELPVSSTQLLKPQIAVKILLKIKGQQLSQSLPVMECGQPKLSQSLISRTTRRCSHQVSKWCSRKPFQQWTMEKIWSIWQTCQS